MGWDLRTAEEEGGFACDGGGDAAAVALDEICCLVAVHAVQNAAEHECVAHEAVRVARGVVLAAVVLWRGVCAAAASPAASGFCHLRDGARLYQRLAGGKSFDGVCDRGDRLLAALRQIGLRIYLAC